MFMIIIIACVQKRSPTTFSSIFTTTSASQGSSPSRGLLKEGLDLFQGEHCPRRGPGTIWMAERILLGCFLSLLLSFLSASSITFQQIDSPASTGFNTLTGVPMDPTRLNCVLSVLLSPPRDCVQSPLLFVLYINACRSRNEGGRVFKFSDGSDCVLTCGG